MFELNRFPRDFKDIVSTKLPPEIQKHSLDCAEGIATALIEGKDFIFDMDGVIFRGDSLLRPHLTTEYIIHNLRRLELFVNRNGTNERNGVATARSYHVVDHLRRFKDLKLKAPLILEEGQILIAEGKTIPLVPLKHIQFIASVKHAMKDLSSYRADWNEVKASPAFTFCPGNYQWQGVARISFWSISQGKAQDQEILKTVFDPTLRLVAKYHGIDYESEVVATTSPMRMPNHDYELAIFSLKRKQNGKPFDKSMAAEHAYGRNGTRCIFVADGYGDTPMKKVASPVIGIKGNLDETNDATEFLREAHFKLESPEHFAHVLDVTAQLLGV